MKDVFSAFGSEVFRPLVTLLLPGALSVSTWMIMLMARSDKVLKLARENRSESIAIIVAVTLFVGLICEEIGSHLEAWFDGKRDRRDGTHKANWKAYWRVAYKLEPIGHHYLRTILLRLKFELGSFVGCAGGVVGLWFLPISLLARVSSTLGVGVLAGFFLYEAWESHELLGDIRAELLNGINVQPAHDSGAHTAVQIAGTT